MPLKLYQKILQSRNRRTNETNPRSEPRKGPMKQLAESCFKDDLYHLFESHSGIPKVHTGLFRKMNTTCSKPSPQERKFHFFFHKN